MGITVSPARVRRSCACMIATATCCAALVALFCGRSAARGSARPSTALYYETITNARRLAIARVSLSGSRRSTDVVEVGNVSVFGIAVGGSSVFWSFQAGLTSRGAIMRAALDGRRVRRLVGGLAAPAGVVVERGFVYWADRNAIGRVALDGSHVRRRFIVLPREPFAGVADGLASDGTHIYFSRCHDHTIGRAGLDGSHVEKAFLSIGRASCPQGLAAAGRYLYWTELGSGMIGRARPTGRSADARWLDIHSDQGPFQLVADAAHVYWSWGGVDGSPSFTGRADADGSHLDRRFLAGSLYAMALAR
jgi:hypothetical protein